MANSPNTTPQLPKDLLAGIRTEIQAVIRTEIAHVFRSEMMEMQKSFIQQMLNFEINPLLRSTQNLELEMKRLTDSVSKQLQNGHRELEIPNVTDVPGTQCDASDAVSSSEDERLQEGEFKRQCMAKALQKHVVDINKYVPYKSEIPDILINEDGLNCSENEMLAGVGGSNPTAKMRFLVYLIRNRSFEVMERFVQCIKVHNRTLHQSIVATFKELTNEERDPFFKVCARCLISSRLNVNDVVDYFDASQLFRNDSGMLQRIIESGIDNVSPQTLWNEIFTVLNLQEEPRYSMLIMINAIKSKGPFFSDIVRILERDSERGRLRFKCRCRSYSSAPNQASVVMTTSSELESTTPDNTSDSESSRSRSSSISSNSSTRTIVRQTCKQLNIADKTSATHHHESSCTPDVPNSATLTKEPDESETNAKTYLNEHSDETFDFEMKQAVEEDVHPIDVMQHDGDHRKGQNNGSSPIPEVSSIDSPEENATVETNNAAVSESNGKNGKRKPRRFTQTKKSAYERNRNKRRHVTPPRQKIMKKATVRNKQRNIKKRVITLQASAKNNPELFQDGLTIKNNNKMVKETATSSSESQGTNDHNNPTEETSNVFLRFFNKLWSPKANA